MLSSGHERQHRKDPSAAEPAKLLLFLGSHFGVLFLRRLRERYRDLSYKVVTRSVDSDRYYRYHSVSEYCAAAGIECLDTTVPGHDVSGFCERFGADLILCGYYDKMLPDEVLGRVGGRAYNIHPGLLPFYRGPFPTAWALLHEEKEIGLTIHLMDRGFDTGPIAVQKKFAILPEETGHELYTRSMDLGAEMLCEFVPRALKRDVRLVDQSSLGVGSYYGKIEPYYAIDWRENTGRIVNAVRIHSKPYFPAFSFLKNKMVLVNRCRPALDRPADLQAPGSILSARPDGTFTVGCGNGVVEITDHEVCPLGPGELREDFIRVGSKFLS